MYEHPAIWRKRIRLQILTEIANEEIETGKQFDDFSEKLEQEMQSRWKLVSSTRKQYLIIIERILANQYVLTSNPINR